VYATGMLTNSAASPVSPRAVSEQPSHFQIEIDPPIAPYSMIALALGAIVFVVSYFDLGYDTSTAFILAWAFSSQPSPKGCRPSSP